MPRRGLAIRPVNSEKHEITWSNLSQDAGTAAISVTVVSTQDPAGTNVAGEVSIGSTVKWVYFEFHFSAAETANVNVVHWKIEKIPALLASTAPNVYHQADKKHILKRGMEMLPVNVSTVFKRIFVVKLPRAIQRFGDQDKLIFTYQASSTQQLNACGIAVFRRYS